MRQIIFSLAALAALATALALPSGVQFASATGAREPVIVIPGVAGSELSADSPFHLSVDDGHGGTYTRDYAAGEKLWVNVFQAALPGDDDYFDALKLKPDGVTPVAPELRVSDIYHSTYDDLIDYLQRQGYVLGRDLWVFAYDWRRDIRATIMQLDGLVTAALVTANGNRADPSTWTIHRVDIVAHSMGGIVGRAYVSSATRGERVDQLITLGSPQLGTAKFLKTLLYGDDFGSTFLGLGLNSAEVKDVVQNMPGGMELLPSRAYYSFYDNSDADHLSPFREDRDIDEDGQAGGALSYLAVARLMLNLQANPTVLDMAQAFQSQFDGLRVFVPLLAADGRGASQPPNDGHGEPGGVRWKALVGTGQATLGQVREYTGVCGVMPCPKRDELPVDGDGTVALFSAAIGDPARERFFTSAPRRWYIERSHSGLVQRDYVLGVPIGDGPALEWIGEQLSESEAQAVSSSSAFAQALPVAGMRGVWVAALGPVAMRARDAQAGTIGRARGADQALPATISDASYDRLPEGEFIYLKRAEPYTIIVDAERQGSVDLKLRFLGSGHVEQTALYLGVQLGQAGRAQLVLPDTSGGLPATDRPQLQLDVDGDGVFESTLAPSAVLDERASADATPPVITLDASASSVGGSATEQERMISWSAADADAGLLREWAVVDPGTPAARTLARGARARFSPGSHRLLIVAQDRAGNVATREAMVAVR
jgi:hypothetical protein